MERKQITLQDCVEMCWDNKDFVKEFNRITNNNLQEERPAIIKIINKICKHNPNEKAIVEFIAFVEKHVYAYMV